MSWERKQRGFLQAKREKDGIARAPEAVHRAPEQSKAHAEFTAGVYAGVHTDAMGRSTSGALHLIF